VPFPLVVAEGDILTVDVPVAGLQLSDQLAFGYLLAPQQTVWINIVGERGKEQTVFPEFPEHGAELAEVFAQECVRLLLCHRPCRVPFARQKPVSVADVWMVLLRVPALKVFRAAHRHFERGSR